MYDVIQLTGDSQVLQLEEPAQFVGEYPEGVIVETEVPQLQHVPHLGRETSQLVAREVEVEEVGEMGYVCRDTLGEGGGGRCIKLKTKAQSKTSQISPLL